MKIRVSSHASCHYVYDEQSQMLATIEEFRTDEEPVWIGYLSESHKEPNSSTATEVIRDPCLIKVVMKMAIAIEEAFGDTNEATE